MKYLGNVVNAFKVLSGTYLKEGMTVLDATCGNGNDSLYLKKLIGTRGVLYAVDVQEDAISATRRLFEEHGFVEDEALKLVLGSHDDLSFLEISDRLLDLAVYNLGFLPKGNKQITTEYDTTLKSLEQVLNYLKSGGLVFVLCYVGHNSGKLEAEHLGRFLTTLDQKFFDVARFEFVNQKNDPPLMWIVEKK